MLGHVAERSAPEMLSLSRLSSLPADLRVHGVGSLVSELWCGASAASKLLQLRGREAVVDAETRELRPGSLPGPPVLLVHGLAADSSCLSTMEGHLHRAGYTVHNVSYSCIGTDVERCAAKLEQEAAWLLRATGSDRLHVVAHSLGGVVLRWAVTHTWMRNRVDVAVTMGSPHRGTPTALLAPPGLPGFGRIIRQLRPGLLDFADGGLDQEAVRWVAIAAEHDWVVPPKYAELPDAPNVRNVVVPAVGHMTLTTSLDCVAIILEELTAAVQATCRAAA